MLGPYSFDPAYSIGSIENSHQLGMIATDAHQLVNYQAASLCLQAAQIAAIRRGFAAVSSRQDITNRMLGFALQSLERSNALEEAILERVSNLAVVVRLQFEAVAGLLLEQRTLLEGIAEVLRRPYETRVLELRREADKWLTSGMKRTGRERTEDFKDAMRLLRVAVDNPVGMQDYVAWFQIGWLLWKQEQSLPEAEEAFYRAARLSSLNGDLYYVKALRHLAYMQYLQSRYAEAEQTIQKALTVSSDHDTRFDAARYAAKLDRTEAMLHLLEQCILERPTTIISMFAEADFGEMGQALDELAIRMVGKARSRVQANMSRWREAIQFVRQLEQQAGCSLAPPSDRLQEVEVTFEQADTGDYLTVLDVEQQTATADRQLLESAGSLLVLEIRARQNAEEDCQRRKKEVVKDSVSKIDSALMEKHNFYYWAGWFQRLKDGQKVEARLKARTYAAEVECVRELKVIDREISGITEQRQRFEHALSLLQQKLSQEKTSSPDPD